MTASATTVLKAVAQRLADEPENVLPTLQLLADPDAVAEATDSRSRELARRVNTERLAARRAQFREHSLTTAEVRALLGGVSRQAVAQQVARRKLLASEIAGRLFFPDWQFGPDGPYPGVPELVAVLEPHGALAADALMRTPIGEAGGLTPAEMLAKNDLQSALHYARIAGGGF